MTTQSLLNRIPDNSSFLQPTKFTFIIPNLPFARYFCQTVEMPGISTSEVLVPTPMSETYRHGDKLIYEPFTITFLMDEDMRTWEETHNWLVSLTAPVSFDQYASRRLGTPDKYYDGILTINTNANLPNFRIKFKNVHPIQLGAVSFNTADSPDVTPTSDLTFRFDTFEFDRDIT